MSFPVVESESILDVENEVCFEDVGENWQCHRNWFGLEVDRGVFTFLGLVSCVVDQYFGRE